MRTRIAVGFIVLSFLTAGCAKGKATGLGNASLGSPSSAASSTPGTSPAPSLSPSASSSNKPGATGSTAKSPSPLPTMVKGMKVAPLEVTLGSTCVRRGSVQSITIKSVEGFQVSYGSTYPDHGTHQEWGGFGVGKIPPGGTQAVTWTVPATARLGDVRTDVAVYGKIDGEDAAALSHPAWRIADAC